MSEVFLVFSNEKKIRKEVTRRINEKTKAVIINDEYFMKKKIKWVPEKQQKLILTFDVHPNNNFQKILSFFKDAKKIYKISIFDTSILESNLLTPKNTQQNQIIPISEIFIDHIQFSNFIILTKPTSDFLKYLILKILNTGNTISIIDEKISDDFFNTTIPPSSNEHQDPQWIKEEGFSFGLKKKKFKILGPFHPERLWKFLNNDKIWKNITVAQGIIIIGGNIHLGYFVELTFINGSFKFLLKKKEQLDSQVIYLLGKDINEDEFSKEINHCLLKNDDDKNTKDVFDLKKQYYQLEFDQLLNSIPNDSKNEFKTYVLEKINQIPSSHGNEHVIEKMEQIKLRLKELTDLSGHSPKENIIYPKMGQFGGYNSTNTLHIDSFLYSDEDVEELKEKGLIEVSYCQNCKSRDIQDLNMISHSLSIEELEFIFDNLKNKVNLNSSQTVILDVGSRLGPLLYYGYYFSKSTFIGVEINEYYANLQMKMINEFKMDKNRVRVVKGDIFKHTDLFKNVSVVVMNNVFEFFSELKKNQVSWKLLRRLINKKGTILITSPSIEQSLKDCKLKDFNIKDWVSKIPEVELVGKLNSENEEDTFDIHFYIVSGN